MLEDRLIVRDFLSQEASGRDDDYLRFALFSDAFVLSFHDHLRPRLNSDQMNKGQANAADTAKAATASASEAKKDPRREKKEPQDLSAIMKDAGTPAAARWTVRCVGLVTNVPCD